MMGLPRSNRWRALLGTRGDRLLLLFSLFFIALSWQQVHALSHGAAMARIYQGDELLASYPLAAGRERPVHVSVRGEIGEAEIVIDGQGARFATSPCRLQRCVHAGAKHQPGSVIACVPNRLLLLVDGGDRVLDAVVE